MDQAKGVPNKKVVQNGVLISVVFFSQVAGPISIFRKHDADLDFAVADEVKKEIDQVYVFLPVVDGYLAPFDFAE